MKLIPRFLSDRTRARSQRLSFKRPDRRSYRKIVRQIFHENRDLIKALRDR